LALLQPRTNSCDNRRYTVISVYLKSRGILLRFTMPAKGGMYSSKNDGICFTLAKSSRCLIHFSVAGRLDRCEFEGDACNPPVDDACNPTDMTLSAMRSMRISSTDFSNALCSPNIHTHNKIDRVGEQTDEVIKWMVRSRKNNVVYNGFSVSSDNRGWKKVVPTQCPTG
jgi:hypothetical protein